jgi:hypothetical protein
MMLSLAFHSYFFLKKRREIKNIVFILFFRKVYKPQKHVTPKICHFQLQLFKKQDSFVHPLLFHQALLFNTFFISHSTLVFFDCG